VNKNTINFDISDAALPASSFLHFIIYHENPTKDMN